MVLVIRKTVERRAGRSMLTRYAGEMPSLPPILLDLDAWDAANTAARRSAAVAAASMLPAGFTLDGLSPHSLGGQTHEVATFRYDGVQFVLLPGRRRAVLGYDRSRPFIPT